MRNKFKQTPKICNRIRLSLVFPFTPNNAKTKPMKPKHKGKNKLISRTATNMPLPHLVRPINGMIDSTNNTIDKIVNSFFKVLPLPYMDYTH